MISYSLDDDVEECKMERSFENDAMDVTGAGIEES
jgi:hypothetical protein